MLPSLNTMAMGDLNAVAYGQTSHLAVLLRTRAVELADFICLQNRPPRAGRQIAGLLIDDFILLDPVPRSLALTSAEPPRVRTMRAVIAGYKESSLPRNESKSVHRAAEAEFWGGLLDGRSGLLRPSPKRVCSLAQFVLKVVRAVLPVKGDLCSELLASAALLCQVDVDLRAPAAPILLTTCHERLVFGRF